jgi:hypothetical protein
MEAAMSDKLDLLAGAERLARCKAEEQAAIERHARREIQRAREAVQRLVSLRKYGVPLYFPYWFEVNRAEACIRDAVRAYRFARGNSPIQTFGTVLIRAAAEARVRA